MGLESSGVTEAVSAVCVSGHRKHPGSEHGSEDAAEEQLVSIRVAVLKKLSFGMGMLQQDVTNAVMVTEAAHTVLAAHLPGRGGSW